MSEMFNQDQFNPNMLPLTFSTNHFSERYRPYRCLPSLDSNLSYNNQSQVNARFFLCSEMIRGFSSEYKKNESTHNEACGLSEVTRS